MKLLIVDDDVYTREGLAENIPWELYGIEEVMQQRTARRLCTPCHGICRI